MKENVQNMSILSNYYDKKDFSGLIDYCNSKIELDNSNYLFLGARGKAYIELEEYDKAIIDISCAIELNPNYIIGFYNRGLCYYYQNKYSLSKKNFEKVKLLSSDFENVNFHLGLTYTQLKKYDKAVNSYTEHLNLFEDLVVLKLRAMLYFLINENDKAFKDITKILLIESKNFGLITKFEKINSIIKTEDNVNIVNNDLSSIQNFGLQFFKNETKIELAFIVKLGFYFYNNEKNSGIYIIEFNNSEFYIGQSKNLQKRIKQHFNFFSDIQHIYFKPVKIDMLLSEENATIAIFEKKLLRIRNLQQINFYNLFDYSHQINWIGDINYNFVSGTKFDNEYVRSVCRIWFTKLREKPYFERIIQLLSYYIKLTIPNYLASEFNYWNITSLHSNNKKILEITINIVSVLTVYKNNENKLEFKIFASKFSFMRIIKENKTIQDLLIQFPSLKIEFSDRFIESTEGDAIILCFNEADFMRIIENNFILSSIRLFNLRMMNITGNSDKPKRKAIHCLDISDSIINRISQDKKKNELTAG